jgi:hypothetical protein
VLCPTGATYASVSFEVVQRVSGGNTARGYGYNNKITCDGTAHAVGATVVAQSLAFRGGAAYVTSTLAVCESASCAYPSDGREVRFVTP